MSVSEDQRPTVPRNYGYFRIEADLHSTSLARSSEASSARYKSYAWYPVGAATLDPIGRSLRSAVPAGGAAGPPRGFPPGAHSPGGVSARASAPTRRPPAASRHSIEPVAPRPRV